MLDTPIVEGGAIIELIKAAVVQLMQVMPQLVRRVGSEAAPNMKQDEDIISYVLPSTSARHLQLRLAMPWGAST